MKLYFDQHNAQFEKLGVLMELDMRIGLYDVGMETMNQLDMRIPPPAGAWDSSKHMARGVMTKAMMFDDTPKTNGSALEMDFGMDANNPSSVYHWAHELGYKPHHTRAKLYFTKSVMAMLEKLRENPEDFFKRNTQVI